MLEEFQSVGSGSGPGVVPLEALPDKSKCFDLRLSVCLFEGSASLWPIFHNAVAVVHTRRSSIELYFSITSNHRSIVALKILRYYWLIFPIAILANTSCKCLLSPEIQHFLTA